ncbi:hypothetical protein [Massiliimalia timonensis]|uniref:hypothetical protein n=1 Tax=Massiliimalia timonensis TaxID=1987501 RepID=UPI001319EA4C|nr:hypothetical protein [Massiliimalia timonensis]
MIALNGSFNARKNGCQNEVLSRLAAPPFLSRRACGHHNWETGRLTPGKTAVRTRFFPA